MAIRIGRRAFISALGGTAVGWPLTARAQPASKLPTIGFLGVAPAVWLPWTDAFVQRLRQLGWIDGRTVTIEYRWAEGKTERYTEIAAEFVRLKVDVIVTTGAAIPTLKRATSLIPIVFAVANDPVAAGMIASLARPGGNATGMSLVTVDLAGKRFQLLHEAVPSLRRLAIIADAGFPQALLESDEVQRIASTLGIEVAPIGIRRAEDLAPAFEALKADALYVVINELLNANRPAIVTSALGRRLPTIFGTRDWANAGGLMSYGPNFPNLFRRAAEIVDEILHGSRPEDIPVEQPTKFELVINLKTAKALGLEVPQSLLVAADEVIE
jgi:putative ABC transport system substrate-binding protein